MPCQIIRAGVAQKRTIVAIGGEAAIRTIPSLTHEDMHKQHRAAWQTARPPEGAQTRSRDQPRRARRRATAAMPASPASSMAQVSGSGTGAASTNRREFGMPESSATR